MPERKRSSASCGSLEKSSTAQPNLSSNSLSRSRKELHLSSSDIHNAVKENLDKLDESYLEDDRKDEYYRRINEQMRMKAISQGKSFIPPLYTFDQVPSYLQDNDAIHTGYRAYCSYEDTWKSIFRVHNETGNIWSHIFGFLMVLGLIYHCFSGIPDSATYGDYFALSFFFICSLVCFAASALFHTHYCQSKTAFVRFGCLDYAGISTMIAGSCVVVTYFAFYCRPLTRNIWVFLTIFISSVGILGPWYDRWTHGSFRHIRALIYFFSALTSATPVFQYLLIDGFPDKLGQGFYIGLFLMTAFYVLGALIYSYRFPENLFPGKFDILLHSHQLWHLCVVAACYSHYASALRLLDWRLSKTQC